MRSKKVLLSRINWLKSSSLFADLCSRSSLKNLPATSIRHKKGDCLPLITTHDKPRESFHLVEVSKMLGSHLF